MKSCIRIIFHDVLLDIDSFIHLRNDIFKPFLSDDTDPVLGIETYTSSFSYRILYEKIEWH